MSPRSEQPVTSEPFLDLPEFGRPGFVPLLDVQARDRTGWRLGHDYVLGPWSLWHVLDCKLDDVAVASPLSICRMPELTGMHKGIRHPICPTDEAVPFFMAEPSDVALLSSAHRFFLPVIMTHCTENPLKSQGGLGSATHQPAAACLGIPWVSEVSSSFQACPLPFSLSQERRVYPL